MSVIFSDLSESFFSFLYYLLSEEMAGVLGFEPRNGGVKVRCLTAWRYPKMRGQSHKQKTHEKDYNFPSISESLSFVLPYVFVFLFW